MATLRALTIGYAAAICAATAVTGYATFAGSRAAVATLVDRRITTAADTLLEEARLAGGGTATRAAILARIAAFSRQRDTADIGFELEGAAGRRLGGNVIVARPLPPGHAALTRADGIPGLTAGRAVVIDAGRGLRLVAIAETEPIDGYAFIRARNFSIGFGSILLVTAAGIAAFALLVRRQIGAVRTTAEAIIDGDLRRRLPVDPAGGAFARQAITFNRMLDRIAGLVDDIRNVSSDVAHDLRTPLARLRSRLVQIADVAPDAMADEAEAAIAECDNLLSIFTAILRIAEVEGGDRRAAFRPVDLGEVAAGIAETLAAVAADSGHILRAGRQPSVVVPGDRQLLDQAVLNLVENALNHTPPGTAIAIAVSRTAITVRDDGPGIPAADRALALRRFGRLDASRHRPGNGLGLSLAQAVARLHGGALTLSDNGPGLVATLSIAAGPVG